MTTNLTTYTSSNGLELFIDGTTGETFVSQPGLANICEVANSTIARYLSGVASIDTKTAEVLTAGGLQGGALYDEKAILKCIIKYNPRLIFLLAKAGLRVYLHDLAGFVS